MDTSVVSHLANFINVSGMSTDIIGVIRHLANVIKVNSMSTVFINKQNHMTMSAFISQEIHTLDVLMSNASALGAVHLLAVKHTPWSAYNVAYDEL